jgi:hypothetical protein
MKYSIRGSFNIDDKQAVLDTIEKYPLWRPIEEGESDGIYSFEVFLNAELDKDNLFEELKPLVQEGESIDWHECCHDENIKRPCVIAETYSK